MSALPTQVPVKRARQSMKLAEDRPRDFTRMERKVLDALMIPELRHAKQKDLCKELGICRVTYWKIMSDPWFQEQRRSAMRHVIEEQASAFVKAAAETAATPGRDGFQDRRLLLSMTGDHVERRQHQHEVNARVVVGVVGVDMADLG
jgi:hypothetical protein